MLFIHVQTPHAVQWIRPGHQEACPVSNWFNILVLHQNRLYISLNYHVKCLILSSWISLSDYTMVDCPVLSP